MRSGRNEPDAGPQSAQILGYWDMRSGRNSARASAVVAAILGYWDMRSGRNSITARATTVSILGYWDMRSGRVQTPHTLDAVISASDDHTLKQGQSTCVEVQQQIQT